MKDCLKLFVQVVRKLGGVLPMFALALPGAASANPIYFPVGSCDENTCTKAINDGACCSGDVVGCLSSCDDPE